MQKKSRVRRGAVILVSAVALLGVAGWLYQTTSERRDLQDHPPPGDLTDIGTHRLHMHCVGSGSPAVILEAGLGNSSLHWVKVQPAIGRFTRVCSYDRGGLGHSEAGPFPRTGAQIVSELEELILAKELQAPFVLVGHSNGALYMRLLASRHPDWAAGLVLVDPSPENAPDCDELPVATRYLYGTLVKLAPFGVPRLALPYLFPVGNAFPAEARETFIALRARTDALQALWSEEQDTCALRAASAQAGLPPAHTHVVVMSAPNRGSAADDPSIDLHRKMAAGFPGAEFVIVENSGHWIQFDQPGILIESVEKIVNDVQSELSE